jgi:hypothetical protein
MTKYQIEYFNNYDVNKATSSRLIPLSGTLPPHEYYFINDSEMPLCYKVTVNSLSLGLSSTAGFIEVLAINQPNVGMGVTPSLLDFVSWSKTAVAGVQTLSSNSNAFLLRQPVDTTNNPLVTSPGGGTWLPVQYDAAAPCKLITTVLPQVPVQIGMPQLLSGIQPPYEVQLASSETDGSTPPPATIPPADIGLMSPQLTELLPNPLGTGNDDTDEFIELYNPNPVDFDLSGFKLQVGATVLHTYTFPVGTLLKASSFSAFYASDTNLSLSNSSGRAAFLDPLGNTLSASDPYSSAKDGQSWVSLNGKWSWTTKPTPNSKNILVLPVTKKSKSKTSIQSKTKQPKSTSTTKLTTKKPGVYGQANYQEPTPSFPIHTATLALIGGLALLYFGYEYRTDLGNKLIELRRNIATWRKNR